MANEKMNEAELEQVTGGHDPYGGVPTNGRPRYIGDPIRLVGPYYESSFAEGKACRTAIGWPNLFAANEYPGRPAGFRVRQANGEDVGWAPRASIEFI